MSLFNARPTSSREETPAWIRRLGRGFSHNDGYQPPADREELRERLARSSFVRLKTEPRKFPEGFFGGAAAYSPFETVTREETRARTQRSPLMDNAGTVRASGGTQTRLSFTSFFAGV